MTGRDRLLKTLAFEEPDRPPHFESMFELEHEAFGLRFPDRGSWATCSPQQKERQIAGCMEIYARIIETYHWDALAVYWPWGDPDGVAAAQKEFGRDILIGGMVGGGVLSIEGTRDWVEFSVDLLQRPERLHEQAEEKCRGALARIDLMIDAGADFIFLPNDVAFNAGPFISPPHFSRFVTPYLARQVERIRERGAIAMVHTDGMLMPILDDLVAMRPHVLHSIDPMAGMDIAVVKERTRGKIALMGNVQCNLLQDGPAAKIRESVRYCLEHAAPGGGYIFSTSNTIFPGMPLAHYDYMLEVFGEFNRERRDQSST